MSRFPLAVLALWMCVLVPFSALAGGRGVLRALEDLQDEVADSDADCSKRLGKKLEALAADVDDGVSARRLREEAREVRSFAEERCPKKLAGKVRRALEAVTADDDDARSRRRSSEDEDEDDAPLRRTPRRDCGTGEDPGCNLPGPAPMDSVSFRGLVSSLSATPNELSKLDIVRNAVSNQRLTAQQLGPVLDAFQNELLRLDAAKAAAPRLVNPQHALVHSGKWRNSLLAADFSKLLAR
jgi:hypothetical protein